jgi:protein-L-isoaspartate(D-aspartate) O-methyltransferase
VIDWVPKAAALAELLVRDTAITDPVWRSVFAALPRHLFVPSYWALDEYNSPAVLVDGADPGQRAAWLDTVYSDRFLITQWAPGDYDGRPIRIVTSSASQPRTVAVMLDRLAVADGHRVLEVGTGTGYNAGLLSARLGDDCVTSVDLDPALVADAAGALAAAGYSPGLFATDGAHGWPGGAPYDRIIATCAVDDIPEAWIDQLTPGGRIVAPLTFGGALVVLDKIGEAEVRGAVDSFAVYFMPLRASLGQAKPETIAPVLPAAGGISHQGSTAMDPTSLDDPDFQLWLALHLRGVHVATGYRDGRRSNVTVYTSRSQATCLIEPAAGMESLRAVVQYGSRLWDTVESAWFSWVRLGRPDRSRLRLVARSEGPSFFQCADVEPPHTWPASVEPRESRR